MKEKKVKPIEEGATESEIKLSDTLDTLSEEELEKLAIDPNLLKIVLGLVKIVRVQKKRIDTLSEVVMSHNNILDVIVNEPGVLSAKGEDKPETEQKKFNKRLTKRPKR